jgi:hypothetical protein
MDIKRTKRKKQPAEMRAAAPPAMPECAPPSKDKPRRDLILCLFGVLIILCAALFTFPWMMHPDSPQYLGLLDSWAYFGPSLSFMDHAIHDDHEFPLWNPLYFCGQPHAANPQSFVFYPPNLLRSLLTFHPTPLRTHTGIVLMVLAYLVIAGIGTLLLARRHGYSRGAALLAALAMSFSAALIIRTPCNWMIQNSTCWLPGLLFCANIMVHGRDRRLRIAAAVWAGAVYGLCILGGVPVLTYMGGLLLGAYWLLETAGKTALALRDGAGPAPAPRWKAVLIMFRADVALFAVLMMVSAMLAAPLLLPLGEFVRQTGRTGTVAALENFAPLGYGWQLVKAFVFYEGHGAQEGVRGGGAAVVALALLALLLRPRWNGLRWAALFMFMLDLSVSEPLLFGRIARALAPVISNNPGRGMMVGCLPLAMLAGWGLDAVMRASASRRRMLSASVLVAAVGVAVLATLLFAAPLGSHRAPLVAVVLPAAALAVAVLGLWLHGRYLTGTIAAMLVLGEALAWNARVLPEMTNTGLFLYQGSMRGLAEKKSFTAENRRITDHRPNTQLYDLQFIMNGYDSLCLRAARNAVTPVVQQSDKILTRNIGEQEPTGMSQRGNLFLKRRFWLAREYCPEPLPDYARLYPAARVVFLPDGRANAVPVPAVSLDQLPETGLSQKSGETSLPLGGRPAVIKPEMMGDPAAVAPICEAAPGGRHASLFLTVTGQGRVTLAPVFKIPATEDPQFGVWRAADLKAGKPQTMEFPMPDAEKLQILLHVTFADPVGEVTVTAAAMATDADDEGDHIQIIRQTANQATLRLTDLPGPRVLLFVDSFYNGWEATVDGKATPILLANDAFKAIVIPAGSCEVRFAFSSNRVTLGLLLSTVAVLLVLAAGVAVLLGPRQTCSSC